jgi:hypothetical protein
MTFRASEFESSQLDLIMRRSVSVLHWASAPDDHRNGSMFFIDTGAGVFGVTAKHVYDEYLSAAAEKYVLCKVDGMRFDPIERLVSAGVMCDVVTFKISNEELRTLDRLTTPWPPVVPEVGQAVLLAGFPGCEKSFSGSNSIDLRMYAAKWIVDSVSERDISIVRPPDSEVLDIHGKGFPEHQYDFGGMSGGPVVIVIDGGHIFSWALSGVIYELQQSLEIFKAVRADVISEDGRLTI